MIKLSTLQTAALLMSFSLNVIASVDDKPRHDRCYVDVYDSPNIVNECKDKIDHNLDLLTKSLVPHYDIEKTLEIYTMYLVDIDEMLTL